MYRPNPTVADESLLRTPGKSVLRLQVLTDLAPPVVSQLIGGSFSGYESLYTFKLFVPSQTPSPATP